MLTVSSFTFGPFRENTYILHDETKHCVIIDPGCFTASEQAELRQFIEKSTLVPVLLLNTHCHVDHVAGNAFVCSMYKLLPVIHKNDLVVLQSQERVSAMYGLPCDLSPMPKRFLEDGEAISFGNSELEVIFTPGHAPGHVVFYSSANKFVVNGDVLFNGSVGRTDLPLGDFATLEHSIRTRMYTLPDETTVYCGHGPVTTIGYEKKNNPFVHEN
jgi:hydroxyacylglutathione hydrolase